MKRSIRKVLALAPVSYILLPDNFSGSLHDALRVLAKTILRKARPGTDGERLSSKFNPKNPKTTREIWKQFLDTVAAGGTCTLAAYLMQFDQGKWTRKVKYKAVEKLRKGER